MQKVLPGALLAPFRWAAPAVLEALYLNPELVLPLVTASSARIHLVGLCLSLSPGETKDAEIVRVALTGRFRDMAKHLGQRELHGLRRAMGRIVGPIMDKEQYVAVADLLADDSAALLLHHAERISPNLLTMIPALPLKLRTPAITNGLSDCPEVAIHMGAAIEAMGRRLSKQSNQIYKELSHSRSFADLRGKLRCLVDALPILETSPPRVVKNAVRIDRAKDIRALGQKFSNCLRDFDPREADGGSSIYHWRSNGVDALCEVIRLGNLGWFLSEPSGVRNQTLLNEVAQTIQADFASVGIERIAVAEALESICYSEGPTLRHYDRRTQAHGWRMMLQRE